MAYSANNTTLSYRTSTSGAFTPIPNLMEVPELGGTPEKIDVTTLADRGRRFIRGTKDFGDLVFRFLYNNQEGGNFRIFRELSEQFRATNFQLTYPDGTAHEFFATPSVKMDTATINGALTFSVSMLLEKNITTKNEEGENKLPMLTTLTAKDYSITRKIQTQTLTSDAEGTLRRFSLWREGINGWGPIGGATASNVIVFPHVGDFAIPTTLEEIHSMSFYVYTMDASKTVPANILGIEPITTSDGFSTHKISGYLEVENSKYAFSITIGAMQFLDSDETVALFARKGVPTSSIRIQQVSGDEHIWVEVMTIGMGKATNVFPQLQNFRLNFKKPLAEKDRVNAYMSVPVTLHLDNGNNTTTPLTVPYNATVAQAKIGSVQNVVCVNSGEKQQQGWVNQRIFMHLAVKTDKNGMAIEVGEDLNELMRAYLTEVRRFRTELQVDSIDILHFQ